MKKIFKLKRTYFVLMLMILSVFVASLFITTDSNQEATFVPYTNYYNSDKYVITSASAPNDENVVDINQLYTINGSTVTVNSNYATLVANKTITISNAEELYAFSVLTNSTSAFLGYSYKLISNIDYSNYSNQFIPVGWNGGTFTGTFDGYGYEIDSLLMLEISTSDSSNYQNMIYFAMFSSNSGTISNFGLVEPRIRIMHTSPNMLGVATVVGNNSSSGRVSFIYVKDTRDVEDAGIYATGGHRISGLVSNNAGSVSDCYVTYTRVVNYAVSDYIDFNELLSDNSGQISNLFFHNSSIEAYTPNGDKETVEYIDSIGKTYTDRSKFGTYNTLIAELNDAVYASTANNDTNKWYASNSYTGIEDEIGLETPITRGISYDNTTKSFTINNEDDYSFMYELMNSNAVFASDQYTYLINNNINLALLNPDNYYYASNIAATIKGVEGTYTSTTLSNGSTSAYPTIFNPSFENHVLVEGIECYGTFPYLSGNVADLNIALNDYNLEIATSSNQKSIGIVCGYTDGANINNVNVYYGTFTIDSNIGSYYFGSIAGVITNETAVSNTTAAGTYNDSNVTASTANSGNFDKVISIGGLVGYISNTLGNVNNSLSAVNLAITGNVTGDLAIGGVIGSGYTTTIEAIDENDNEVDVRTSNLENNGTITISSSVSATNLYVGGVLGCQFGMTDQVTGFNNEGDITLNGVASTSTYVAGVANANLNEKSQLASSGMRQYFASAFTNGADVTVNKVLGTVNYSYVLNIDENGYQSKVTGIYNLGYKENTTLGAPTIDMDLFTEFSPVINYIGGSSTYTLSAETVYNFRSYNFELSGTPNNTTFTYTGAIKGNNINYTDIRNEGNLTFNLTPAINSSTLNVSGLFDNLNNGFTANNLFNDGNITVNDNSTNNKYLDIYIAGICRVNNAVLTASEQNPLNSNFDNTLVGSLNNAINNGDILVTCPNLDRDTASNVINPNVNLYSDIYIGGITYNNTGIISNAFNLGIIQVEAFSKQLSNYNAGGITCVNNGQYAQIRDCANNGDLFVVDVSDDYASKVNVGGIVANNLNEGTNINQVIAFTINYGTITAFQSHQGMAADSVSVDNSHTAAGGIIGQGLCNMVNILNYGNVQSSECAGGLAAVVDLGAFANTTANIANTINYGNVRAIPVYYATDDNPFNYMTLNKVLSLDYVTYGSSENRTYVAALISLFDFREQTNVNVRYLINFFGGAAVVYNNLNVPNTNIDVSTFITTRGMVDSFGANGNYIKYAPLTNIEDDLGNIGVFSEEFVFRKAINGIGLDDNYVTDKYITEFFQFVRFDKVNEELLKSMGWQTIAYADAAENLAKNLEALSTLIEKSNSHSLIQSDTLFNGNTWIENSDTTILTNFIELSIESEELDSAALEEVLNYVLFDESCISDFTSELKSELFEIIMGYYEQQELDYYELLNKLLYPELVAKIISGDTSDYAKVQQKIEEVLSKQEIVIDQNNSLYNIYAAYIGVLTGEVEGNLADTNSVLYTLFDSNATHYEQTKINLLYALLEGYNDDTLMEIYKAIDPTKSDSSLKYLVYLQANTSEASEIYRQMIVHNVISENPEYLEIINNRLKQFDFASIDSLTENIYFEDFFEEGDYTIQHELGTNGTTIIKEVKVTPTLDVVTTKDYTELWNIIKNDADVQKYISGYFNTYTDYTYGGTKSGLLAKATEWNNSYQSNDASQSSYGIPEDFEGGLNISGTGNGGNSADDGPDYFGDYHFYNRDSKIITRFIYTPDDVCSTETYYYGPYQTDGQPFNQGGYLNSSSVNYNLGFNFTSMDDGGSGTVRKIAPVFISPDRTLVSNLVAGVNNTDKTIYEFYWNDCNSVNNVAPKADLCWKTKVFTTVSSETYGYIYKNYNTSDYIMYNYDFSPNLEYTINYDNTLSNIVNIDGNNINLTLLNADGNHKYQDHYLTGYVSSTVMTGIWYLVSKIYKEDYAGTSLFGKNQTNYAENGYYGVHTTDYICYEMADLVKLDGIRTKGMGSDTSKTDQYHAWDNDETAIISSIVANILSTDEGRKTVIKAIGNYGKSNDYTIDNEIIVKTLLTSLSQQTSFSSDFIINSLDEIFELEGTENNIWYDSINGITIKEYLDSLGIVLDNIKDEIVSASVSDLSNFRAVLLKTHEICEGISKTYSNYVYDRNEVNSLVYNYIIDTYGAELSSDEISELDSMFASISEADLTNMMSVFEFDEVLPDGYSNSGYTFNGNWTVTKLATPISYDGVDYTKELTAGDAINNTYSSITFNSGANLSINVVYDGTMIFDGEEFNSYGEVCIDNIELEQNQNYTLYFTPETKIYGLEYESQYPMGTTPWGTLSGSGYGTTNTGYTLAGSNDKSNYLQLTFNNTVNATVELSFNYTRNSSNNSVQLYYDSIGNNNLITTLKALKDDPTNYKLNVDNEYNSIILRSNREETERQLTITSLTLTYTYTLTDGTTYTLVQSFSGNGGISATCSLVNNTSEKLVGIQEGNGNIVRYSISSDEFEYTDEYGDGEITSAITFYTYATNSLDFSTISGDKTTTFCSNLNNGFDQISDIGKYIINDVIQKQNNTNEVSIKEPSFVIFKANGVGTISIAGQTIETSQDSQYYSVYVENSGIYNITSTGNTSIEEVYVLEADSSIEITNDGTNDIITVLDGTETKEILNLDYSDLVTFDISTLSSKDELTYQTFIDSYIYYRDTTNASYENDIYQIISKLYGTIHQDSNHPFVDKENQGYYSIFKDEDYIYNETILKALFTSEDLREIIELLILADNTAYQTLITNLGSDYYDDILKAIKDPNMQANIMIKIREIADENNITKIQQLVEAAYLGNNYLDNLNTLDDTLMYDILDSYYVTTEDEFLFINSDNSIDAVKFTNLINHLSGSSSVDLGGYGIFALSSSKGIGDGIFIPDNFVLSEMDTNYDANNKLIDQNEGYWRGGTASDDNAKTENSVNHAFYVDMKQLKKSISTTIFTLDLEDKNGNIIYSSEELIDVENGTITYYVTSANDVSSVTIDRLVIANSASSNKDVGATLSLQAGENANQILITAEDTTVFTNYTIIIEVVDIAYNISSNVTTLDYVGGNVPITITSIDGKEIPTNIDVTPYIWLVYVGTNGEEIVYQYGNEDSIYDIVLSSEDGDHIIDENGDSVATVIIPSDLITGTYRLYVSILGVDPTNAKYIQFTKNPSTEANMSSVRVDGVEYAFNDNLEATTPIPFGRAYSDTELIDMSYLDYLPTFSVGADVEVAAEMAENNGLVTYTVTYTITPEQGNPNVYKHYLVETAPYEVGDKYADWFIDGSAQDLDTYAGTNDHIYAEFDRGIEPLYRVRYIMDNFYTLGDIDYTYTISNMYTDSTAGVTASTLYAGISAVVTEMADVGTYEFEYTYTSTGTWDGVPYTREYTFPSLIVTKNASKDATFSRITFLDSDIIAGEMSTIINPDYAMLPTEDASNSIAGEYHYEEFTNGTQPTYIEVRDKTVNYEVVENKDYATTNKALTEFTNHFFVLGSVSDAKLAYYAPTFDAEDHAEVYQYTTLGKLQNYGAGQTASDTDLLAININDANEVVLLYVPFVDANGEIVIYLVQLEDGKWTNVYNTDYNGTQTAIGNMNGDKTTEINGCTVHESAGSPINNTSLYMDFIGDPAEDHFWYVSYIVLSEDFLTDSTAGTADFNNEYYKCYHISLIDMTNTVYYDITVETPEEFALESLYITLSYTTFDENNNSDTKQISGYASENEEYESTTIDQYLFNNNLTVLPNGYYYFYVDLPDGYSAIYYVTNGKTNRNDNPDYEEHDKEGFDGAYLPPASIVTQRVSITIEIVADSDLDQSVWAESTSSIYTKQIKFTTKEEN